MTRERPVRICEGGGVRFPSATRLVICFQYRSDALRVQDALRLRLGKFGLTLEPTKTKLVEFGRFAQRHAGKRGRNRPETIYFLGLMLYCTRNRKGNFKVGMRTEKSRLRRSLMSLQELMRRIRHHRISDQVSEINAVLRGHYAYYGVAGNIRSLREGISGRGALLAQDVAQPQLGRPVASPGTPSTKSNSGHRYCSPNCASHTGSCRRSQCCEPTAEERGAVNPHATFCGNRGRATASGDPVGGEQSPFLPRPPHKASRCRRVIVVDKSPESAVHENNYHHRDRPCKEGVPNPRRRCRGQGRRRPEAQSGGVGVLRQDGAVSGRHGGLWQRPLFGA